MTHSVAQSYLTHLLRRQVPLVFEWAELVPMWHPSDLWNHHDNDWAQLTSFDSDRLVVQYGESQILLHYNKDLEAYVATLGELAVAIRDGDLVNLGQRCGELQRHGQHWSADVGGILREYMS